MKIERERVAGRGFELGQLALLMTLMVVGGSGLSAAPPSSSDVIKNSENTLRLADGASSPKAQIEQLAWLSGYWTGVGLGGETEEMWTPPVGDRMHGLFTLRRDGEIVFSEAMILIEKEGSLVLRLKHFDSDFVGWEDKQGSVDFPLVQLGDREAYLSGLTLRRDGDRLLIYLVLSRGDERSEERFVMQRTEL